MTLNCKGHLLDLTSPKVMGILNITPDSFFDGGSYKNEADIISQVEKMIANGAAIIDVGAYSSRPNSPFVSETEELQRILPIVTLLVAKFPNIILSIDTFRSKVADVCINEGAAIINDISGGHRDKNMLATIAKHHVPYIMMHMRGDASNMQEQIHYKDMINDILFYFSNQIEKARLLGISDLVIDPGFGFAKTREQNFQLLNQLELLNITNIPVLAGVSRKSMIHKTLNITAKEALNGTTALHMFALQKGAKLLRVHDVKEAVECVELYNNLSQS